MLTDDDLYSLFAFDPLDLVGAPLALPPIAGGADLSDFWDIVKGIFGTAGDFLEKIGRGIKALWDRVWGWVGGSLRWIWDHVRDWFEWIARTLQGLLTSLWNKLQDVQHYLWDKVEWAQVWLRDRINDARNYLWAKVEWAQVWLRDRVNDSAGWVRDRLIDARNYLWAKVEWAQVWLRDRVNDARDYLWNKVEWAQVWLRDRVNDSASWIRDRLIDARDYLWAKVEWAQMWLRDRVDAARDWLWAKFEPAITGAADFIGDKFHDAFDWFANKAFEPLVETIEFKLGIPKRLIRGEYHDLGDFIDDITDPLPAILTGITGPLILAVVTSIVVSAIMTILIQPLCLPYTQNIESTVGAQLLTVGVVQQALNRGFIDEATAADHLSRSGYSGSAKQALLELRNIIPSPTDLIRMAVREVFNPSLRESLTLDAEYPDAFTPWARQLGISEDWARNYWAMHWDLPSPSQGYEMLHRGEIEMPQLVDLIKALDFAPVWRDKLINIAYNPITRVDLRRLYKGGIITEEVVFRGYKAQGYNDENARYLTDYTKKYYSPEDASQLDDMADLAVSTFRTAYRRHVITRDEALDRIVEAGYTEDVADFLLSIDDAQLALNPTTDAGVAVRDLTVPIIRTAYAEKLWDRARAQQELEALGYLPWEADLLLQLEDLATQRELTDLEETVVKEEYVKRAIDRPTASSRLDSIGVGLERRDLLLRRWDLQAAQKTRALTVAQVQRGLRDGLFSEAEVLSRFSGMGYNEADSKFLVDITDETAEGIARRLSVGQLSRAYKMGAITDAQLLSGLLALGYSQPDAQVLIDIATPAPAAKERQLSAGQLQTGFRSGLVTEAELLEKLTALGYAQADAELLRDIAAQKPEPQPRRLAVANLKELFKAGTIDKAGLLAELLALGYTDRDAGWLADLIAGKE